MLDVDGVGVYVTVAQPRHIVRIASATSSGGSRAPPASGTVFPLSGNGYRTAALELPGYAGRPVADSGFQLDLTDLSDDEVDQFYTELRQRITTLTNSVDSQVRFSLDGRGPSPVHHQRLPGQRHADEPGDQQQPVPVGQPAGERHRHHRHDPRRCPGGQLHQHRDDAAERFGDRHLLRRVHHPAVQ